MAKDAYWFRHDANARNDIKIIELRSLHGYEGYGLYFGILEVMREQAQYAIPENKIGMVSVALGESPQKVKEVMEDCISVGLFERNDGLIYSPSFLDRMSKWDDMKNRNESNGSKGGRPKKNPSNNPSDNPNNNPLVTQNKPSIEEDIKGEKQEIGIFAKIEGATDYLQLIPIWAEYRKTKGHYASLYETEVIQNAWAKKDLDTLKSEILKAIENGWKSLVVDKSKPDAGKIDMKEAYKGFKPLL
jgi:hypothetical protein